MNETQMKYFLKTAECGSFSRTAEAFYTTQPTVSRQIQLLEDELGYALFYRNTKPLTLTAAGNAFAENLGTILNALENLKLTGKLAANGSYGKLKVAFPLGLNVEDTYAELLADIRSTIPGLQIRYLKQNADKMKEALSNGRIDAAIALHNSAIAHESFRYKDLAQLKSYILVAGIHPLAGKEALQSEDLLEEDLYLIRPVSGYSLSHGYLAGFRIDRNKIIEVDNIATALLNVRFGNGVTIVNDFMRLPFPQEDFKLFPVPDNSRNPWISLVRSCYNTNPAAEIFEQLISQYKLSR